MIQLTDDVRSAVSAAAQETLDQKRQEAERQKYFEMEARRRKCKSELDEVLKKFNCAIEPAMTVLKGGAVMHAGIMAQEDQT